MKSLFKVILTFFVLTFLFNCASNKLHQIPGQLIENFINNKEVAEYQVAGKIPILKSDYCEEVNCQEIFKGYEKSTVFYTKEELFMRGISKFVEIENINKKTNQINAAIKNGANSKNIEIR